MGKIDFLQKQTQDPLKYPAMESENKGKTDEQDIEEGNKEMGDGTIIAPIEIIIPVIDDDDEEEEEEDAKPKKKKKPKVKKADKVRNLTLSLGEAMKLIMKEEVKKKKQAKDEHIRKLAMEQKAKRAAA